jgi:nitrogen fixation protein FixH
MNGDWLDTLFGVLVVVVLVVMATAMHHWASLP